MIRSADFGRATSGLDPVGRMKVRQIIQHLEKQGKTVFFSSHELGEVETVCDRVAICTKAACWLRGRWAIYQQYQCQLEQDFSQNHRVQRSLDMTTSWHWPEW